MSGDYQKLDWQDVRGWVEKLNKPLFDIIDEINPKEPIYLLKYPYGVTISDDKYFYFPEGSGREPLEGKNWPYIFVCEKKLEVYLDYKNRIVPEAVYAPGDFFPNNYEISRHEGISFRPTTIFKLMSGMRNISLLPLAQKNESFHKLRYNFKVPKKYSPEKQDDHFEIIRSISDSLDTGWQSQILIFESSWKKNIYTNPEWSSFRNYIADKAIRVNASKRNHYFLDHAMKDAITSYDLKLKPLSIEMIKHVLNIGLGEVPGKRPAFSDDGVPLSSVVSVFKEIYSPSSPPILIEPHVRKLFNDNDPIYHSIAASSQYLNDKKTFRPLYYLNEVHKHFIVFLKAFVKHPFTSSTVYGSLYNAYKLRCYSVLGDSHGIKSASKLIADDEAFSRLYEQHKTDGQYSFPSRSIFSKALISINIDSKKIIKDK